MSTEVRAVDDSLLRAALQGVRAGTSAGKEAFVLVGHPEGNPNLVDVVTEGCGLDELQRLLVDSEVQYALVRVEETIDMSTTTKFVYIHWIGDHVPFTKKGRFGVVHGGVQDLYFRPYHSDIETSSRDEISAENIMKKISETSGMKSKVLDVGAAEAMPKRGFTSVPLSQPPKSKTAVIPVSSQGAVVKYGKDVVEGIAAVKIDDFPQTWVVLGYTDNDVNKPLQIVASGCGLVQEIKEFLSKEAALYALYRTTDIVDGNTTVKFVYIAWVGENVKPMAKARLSTHKGTVDQLFAGAHVYLFASAQSEITEAIITDKVQSASGTKSHVK